MRWRPTLFMDGPSLPRQHTAISGHWALGPERPLNAHCSRSKCYDTGGLSATEASKASPQRVPLRSHWGVMNLCRCIAFKSKTS